MVDEGQSLRKRSRLLPALAAVLGILLILSGVAATIGYLVLPVSYSGRDMLTSQLGGMAAMFLGLVGGLLLLAHGVAVLRNRPSRTFRTPPVFIFGLVFALVLGLGNLLLNFDVAQDFLFPPLFLFGAALPTLGVLAWAGRRLNWPISWRQAMMSLVSGGTLSILVTLILGTLISYTLYILIAPLEFLAYSFEGLTGQVGDPGFLERLFLSPWVWILLVITALEAPFPEEFAKALGPGLWARRWQNERQAFMAGLAAGAGFAILENMLYEGLYAQWGGWTWGGVTLLRGLGAVLHPLGTGIITLALFRERQRTAGWFGRLMRAYLLAVGLHTLWNGGFQALVALGGWGYYGDLGPEVSLYGEAVQVLLIVYLAALSVGLWWLLRRIVTGLAQDSPPALAPLTISRRALGAWAFACALVIIPIGAALGPAWEEIRAVLGL